MTADETKASSSDHIVTVLKQSLEVSNSENVRLNTETRILKMKLIEATNNINLERPDAEINIVLALKYEEMMRNGETINSISDCNRVLREERDALNEQVVCLSKRLEKDDLLSLQQTNGELLAKINEQASENQSLRTTTDQWRKRCNSLVDRIHKNPEEFKRLQTECENLATKLSTEIEAIQEEKARLDAELSTVLNNCQAHLLEKTKFSDELNVLKASQQHTATEIMELKSTVVQKEAKIKKITDDLTAAVAEVKSLKGKETHIRKIAKRYKDTVSAQSVKIEQLETVIAAQPSAEENSTRAALTSELTAQKKALQAKLDQQQRENKILKKYEDATLLSGARVPIKAPIEVNYAEQKRSERDLLVARQNSQFDPTKVLKTEEDTINKEDIARLTSEGDTSDSRANQLNFQGSKPSTILSGIKQGASEASRTINVKPMARQSATVTLRRGGDSPLASIRPTSVQINRTAAVLPTTQSSNFDDRNVPKHVIVEVIPQDVVVLSQSSPYQDVFNQNQAACTSSEAGTTKSTSAASSSSAVINLHHQASKNTVTTTQATGHKRTRAGDSNSMSSENKTSPTIKRARSGERSSESGLDIVYQVPTSSRRVEEDKNVIMENSEGEQSSSDEQDEESDGQDHGENNPQNDKSMVEVNDSSEAHCIGSNAIQAIFTLRQNQEPEQIQAISSGREARSSTTRHIDDISVPSTNTLHVPGRADWLVYSY